MADFAFRSGPVLKHEQSTEMSPGFTIHEHGIHKGGQRVGHVRVMTDTRHPDEAHISDVRVSGGPGSLGASGVRKITKQLKEHYPAIGSVSGQRISGARGRIITEKGGDPDLEAPTVTQKFK